MTGDLLRARGIGVRRGASDVLAPCDVELAAGDRLAIYGPNGAGKSTLLQALAGFLPLACGAVSFQGRVLGRDISLLDFHRRTAAVFQEPLLLRGTVRHNVELGLRLRGAGRAECTARAAPWLERLGIAHLADRPIDALSGGEAQRTSLARALVLEPQILFLDEPFAALDAPTRTRLADELCVILEDNRMAAIFVTHDIDEAAHLCQQCLVIDAARVLQHGPMPQVLQRPGSPRVARICGARNVFSARVAGRQAEGLLLDWKGQRLVAQGSAPVGSSVEFMIRPEFVGLAREGAPGCAIRGQVVHVRHRAREHWVAVSVGNDRVELRRPSGDTAVAGGEALLSIPAEAIWIFETSDDGLERAT